MLLGLPREWRPGRLGPALYDRVMALRQRVVVYVEREGELLVFDHRDHRDAGTQVPAGGVLDGEGLVDAAVREVREETGLELDARPVLLGTHEHLDGLGRGSLSHYFRVDAPHGVPRSWEHVVAGEGDDAGLVFLCRFEPDPTLFAVQAVFRTSRAGATESQLASLLDSGIVRRHP